MGRFKEEPPDHQGSAPEVIPKGVANGNGGGRGLAYLRETKQRPHEEHKAGG